MQLIDNSLKAVNNLILPFTIIVTVTGGLLIKFDLLDFEALTPTAQAQAEIPKIASFPYRNRVKTKSNNNVTDTYLDVPYINQCKDSENSSLWPNAIGLNGLPICRLMCGAASSVMLLSYFGKYPNDPNNPRVLRNKLIDDRPAITNVGRYGNATFGGAYAVTSREARGASSSGNSIVDLFNRYNYMSITSNGQEVKNEEKDRDGNIFKYSYEKTNSSPIYNRVKIAIDRGNPIIVSTKGHIRAAIGYDNKGNIIVNDPWNNSNRLNNSIISLDGKYAKYGSTVKPISIDDSNNWVYTIEFTEVQPPEIKSFSVGQRVKSYQKFSNDPIEGLNVRTTPGGSVIKRISWKLGGTITSGPNYGGQYWAYKVRFDDGTEGFVSEIYIKDISFNPIADSYTIDQKVYSRSPDGVNIREEPSVGGKLIKFQPSMQFGKAIRRVDNVTDYNWFYIEWEDGTKGWSATDLISTTYTAPRKIGRDAWVNWDTNLRNLNTTNSNVIKKYPKGAYVWVIEEGGNADGFEWVLVTASEPPFWQGGQIGDNTKNTGYMIKQNINNSWVSYDKELYSKDVPYLTKPIDKLVDGDTLNVREQPNGSSKILESIPWDTEVRITDGVTFSYGYNRVQIKYTVYILGVAVEKIGWVPVEFLQKK